MLFSLKHRIKLSHWNMQKNCIHYRITEFDKKLQFLRLSQFVVIVC